MLYWIDNNREVKEIPKTRKGFFYQRYNRLSESEIELIKDYINSLIDSVIENNKFVFVPGQHVPKTWENTPLDVIWAKACNKDTTASALWFGLITMQIIIDRDEIWRATKINYNNNDIARTTYFLSNF